VGSLTLLQIAAEMKGERILAKMGSIWQSYFTKVILAPLPTVLRQEEHPACKN